MNSEFSRYLLLIPFVLFGSWIISCSGKPGKTPEAGSRPPASDVRSLPPDLIKMTSPSENAELKLGEQLKIVLVQEKASTAIDSVRIFFDSKPVTVLKRAPWECAIPSPFTNQTGRKSVKAVAYSKDKTQTVTRFVIVYSDVIPKRYRFRIVHTYPHDSEAFTQGLFYDKGLLYEGTGQESGSSLREVELETGKVLRQHNLDPALFGEGITLYSDRIYQVTWTSKVGFVYNRSDFKQINKIFYQTQGWGLATVDKRIVMSDGTNILYFYEPEMFDAVSRIEVYDNEKKVDQLNELEYIDGEIWANIWQSDLIARIDPSTGKVNSYVDLSQLFPVSARNEVSADVLNGIAYDPSAKRIFVTGKRWPKLYEIKVTE